MHAIASWTKFTAIPTYLQPLIGSNPGIWNTPGVNIDIDNLLTTPPKTTASDPAPSMNQLAHTGIPFSGPNYNINTASLMGPSHPTQPMARPMGMGQMGGGIGMSYGGAPRMGMQPGVQWWRAWHVWQRWCRLWNTDGGRGWGWNGLHWYAGSRFHDG